MTTDNDAYSRLAEKIGAPGYASYIKILENQLTLEEAEFLVGVEEGETNEQLAKRLNIDEKRASEMFDDLYNRRFIQKRDTGNTIPKSPRFFPQGPNDQRTRELRTEFFRSGDYQKILVDGWIKRLKDGGRPSHKVIPAKKALLASPNIRLEDILWYEDMEEIFRRAKSLSQNGLKEDGTLGIREEGRCGCRSVWTDACDAIGGCTWWEWKEGEWETDKTRKLAAESRPARPEYMRKLNTVDEVLDACYQMEDNGQIHISPNTAQITGTCNCCECCCVIMQPMKNYGDIYTMLALSRFRTVFNQELCIGCQTCVERCHFDAVEMRKTEGSKKMKAYVVNEHCMGCGLCVFKCEQSAIQLELVRPPEHIPTTPWVSPSFSM